MKTGTMAKRIYVTRHDHGRLRELVNVAREFGREDERYLKDLEKELDRAKIVRPENIPEHVITMHSKAVLQDRETGSEVAYTLVFPSEADPSRYRVSVLAPIGTAMLGYSVGDTFEWETPRGLRRLEVKEILYQPESAGELVS
jgi:regulator of nucleoside diphosphate kinase